MSQQFETEINSEVISSIVGAASLRTEGVHSMDSSKQFSTKTLSKGVNIVSSTEIDVSIAIEHGYTQDIAANVRENIKEDIQNTLGIKIATVNVFILNKEKEK